ncbi:glycosyltransferase family 39 protein [Krasilnikovia sp. M28-CT-15]|uniref:glycosyltransferase family 39 protein n=1 Tax=Krasilnikovia sp. M28-CT-15 TaxID=3373540 RepID=UPI00399CB847
MSLLAGAGLSVLLLGLAVTASRSGHAEYGMILFVAAVTVPFVVSATMLLRRRLSAPVRRWAVVVVGVLPTLLYRLTDPLLLTSFDEQLHLRTYRDLLTDGPLFSPNPLLAASPYFPGLELLTLALQRATGVPTMVTITLVVVLCRLVLVLALYRLAEAITGDARSAGVAVLCYAVSPQFYLFNSLFAYQTLALSLAVAGLSLLVRAARAERNPAWPTAAALVCFLGVAITHHLTSWISAAVLLVWLILGERRDRRVVGVVAAGTFAAVIAQAIPIAGQLRGYFGPMFGGALHQAATMLGGRERALFSDGAGAATPGWERVMLTAYAVVCTAAAVVAGVALLRHAWRRRHRLLAVVGLLCLAYPATFAGRLAPEVAEVCDRASTFAFLVLSLGIAWLVSRRAEPVSGATPVRGRRYTAAVVAVAGLASVGGLLLGSGPDWARLPGSFLVVADSRSLDAETLAAVAFSRDHLEPGSTIMADRMPATVLASTARLWPDVHPRAGIEPAMLYFSDTWGPEQTRTVTAMGLRYLYVDTRLAEGLPHRRWYFYAGETPQQRQLTPAALTKFAAVPGIVTVYRHGPVAIYDLQGLGGTTTTHGWTGDRHPQPRRDALLGLLVGTVLLALRASVRRGGRALLDALGGAGAAATGMATVALLTGAAVAAGFRPGWQFAAPIALALAVSALRGERLRLARPGPAVVAAALCAAAMAVAGAGLAVLSARSVDVDRVATILTEARQEGR